MHSSKTAIRHTPRHMVAHKNFSITIRFINFFMEMRNFVFIVFFFFIDFSSNTYNVRTYCIILNRQNHYFITENETFTKYRIIIPTIFNNLDFRSILVFNKSSNRTSVEERRQFSCQFLDDNPSVLLRSKFETTIITHKHGISDICICTGRFIKHAHHIFVVKF